MIRVNLLRPKLVRRMAERVVRMLVKPKLQQTDSGRVVLDVTMQEVRAGRWIKQTYNR